METGALRVTVSHRSARQLRANAIRQMDGAMSKIVYKIMRHDGGWAYQANGTFSEAFRTRGQAREAARLAAREQSVPGETATIEYEDANGKWHREVAEGVDRPVAVVKD